MLDIILLILLCAVLSGFACGKIRQMLINTAILDTPNERSLHSVPVPRGGGIGIWLAIFPVWVIYDLIFIGNIVPHILIMLGAALLIIISWLDDKKSLPVRVRFLVHMVAVSCGLMSLPIDQFIFQGALPFWLDRLVAGFAWLWFINLTNFMDGIDGISGAQTIHTSLAFLIVATLVNAFPQQDAVLAACLCGGAIGFLFWNWHPAKLFLGDVGSIPLGFLLGYLMMLLAINGYLGIAIIIPLYYIADASLTLIRRMLQKKKFWQAHREHFYQKAALAASSHTRVLIPIIISNIGLLAIAVAALNYGAYTLLLAPLLVAGLLWYLSHMRNDKGEPLA